MSSLVQKPLPDWLNGMLEIPDSDMKEVHGLFEIGSGWWLVFFETPFATYPRFVVVEYNPVESLIRKRFRCGEVFSAERDFLDRKRFAEFENTYFRTMERECCESR